MGAEGRLLGKLFLALGAGLGLGVVLMAMAMVLALHYPAASQYEVPML